MSTVYSDSESVNQEITPPMYAVECGESGQEWIP